MGDVRAEEYITAQTFSRGSDVPMLPASKKPPFHSWTPSAYNDAGFSADLWSRFACADSNAGSISCGNHLCMPQVCFQGRWAKLGFCRMIFWHWRACVSAKRKAVVKRAHGHLLQPRWDQEGFPPIITSPPQAGMPALERNHAYHFKMTPGLMLGPRCNHDLGILLRLPVLDDDLKEALLKAWHRVKDSGDGSDHTEADDEAARGVSRLSDESIEAMVEVMVDHEYYASDYASKDQPQAANLLQTLHDSLVRHDRFAAEREVAGTIDEAWIEHGGSYNHLSAQPTDVCTKDSLRYIRICWVSRTIMPPIFFSHGRFSSILFCSSSVFGTIGFGTSISFEPHGELFRTIRRRPHSRPSISIIYSDHWSHRTFLTTSSSQELNV